MASFEEHGLHWSLMPRIKGRDCVDVEEVYPLMFRGMSSLDFILYMSWWIPLIQPSCSRGTSTLEHMVRTAPSHYPEMLRKLIPRVQILIIPESHRSCRLSSSVVMPVTLVRDASHCVRDAGPRHVKNVVAAPVVDACLQAGPIDGVLVSCCAHCCCYGGGGLVAQPRSKRGDESYGDFLGRAFA
ncbi:hypothetical protein K505DRAFT_18768 [Melanomma pulvis-pyrius CBS 109.77]|uniref:Uncharacterized protein n=1 Tax=Melanomma pulvis-pyrius CBS 109.77 TaxID=1314802 RepID=A0A6A6XFJ3_9PLEO|nr:hypothetical protein K505DRAFT_18768 [Melanomma pulvis-pyrius CBS 109.77]